MRRVHDNPVEQPDWLLVDIRQLGRLLSVSTRTIHRLLSVGEFPEPVRLGRSIRWQRDVVEKWIASGCKLVE